MRDDDIILVNLPLCQKHGSKSKMGSIIRCESIRDGIVACVKNWAFLNLGFDDEVFFFKKYPEFEALCMSKITHQCVCVIAQHKIKKEASSECLGIWL